MFSLTYSHKMLLFFHLWGRKPAFMGAMVKAQVQCNVEPGPWLSLRMWDIRLGCKDCNQGLQAPVLRHSTLFQWHFIVFSGSKRVGLQLIMNLWALKYL